MFPLGVIECSVLSGFFANVPCVFPFVYNGVEYNQCTFEDSEYRHDQPWYVDMICYEHFYDIVLLCRCATTVTAGSQYVPRHWGNCGAGCPIEEKTRTEEEVSLVWGAWSVFSPCSRECGGGQTVRYRECQLKDPSLCPHLNQTQIRSCNFNPC